MLCLKHFGNPFLDLTNNGQRIEMLAKICNCNPLYDNSPFVMMHYSHQLLVEFLRNEKKYLT